ncbi:MAG: cytochrome c biogenesis protein CcsA [Verrucomicrobiota bacterium]
MKKWFPLILVVIFAAWGLSGLKPLPPKDGFDLKAFGQLPVLWNGRVQPFDSVGQNALLSMSGKSSVRTDDKKNLSATEWLLEAIAKPEQADSRKVFRAQHPDLENLLGSKNAQLEYYSFNDLTNHLEEIEKKAKALVESEGEREDAAKLRTPFQKDLMHLYESIILYHFKIKNAVEPEGAVDFTRELGVFHEKIPAGLIALQASEAGEEYDKADLQTIAAFFRRYQTMSRYASPLTVPPKSGEPRQAWSNMGNSLMESMRSNEIHPAVTHLAAIATTYAKNQPAEFNKAVSEYRGWLQSNNLSREMKKGGQEFLFNQLQPFYKAMVIYVAALLLGCAFWLNLSEWVRRSAFSLLGLAFVIHTVGLLFRMYLEGRPPVTNLYSSAIFVGWGAVVLGIILEKIFKGGIGLVAAAFVGFVTQIIAHHLSLSGDTMEMLRAVLDTNIWLSTHVVVITTGYASMFVAGLLAIIYILRGFFTKTLSPDTAKSLTRMVYGIICFATLFSFVGTILGGIWADQSWGRFWGWDPKENGALLIVIWCAIVLHARWGGLVKERGLMALAVFGNIITSFSWFGVNMLGIGLHSYGFMDSAATWLTIFIASQVLIILLALLPPRFWASFKTGNNSIQPTPSKKVLIES